MINCQEAEDLFSRFLDKRLDASETSAIKQHLSLCPKCRQNLELMQDALKLFQKAEGAEQTAPVGLLARVLGRINADRPRSLSELFARIIRPTWPVLAVAAVVMLAFYIPRITRTSTPGVKPEGSINALNVIELQSASSGFFSKIEMCLASAGKDYRPALTLQGAPATPPSQAKVRTDLAKRLGKTQPTTISIEANTVDLLASRTQRLPVINALKSNGILGENTRGMLETRPGRQIPVGKQQVVQQENADRTKLINIFATKYLAEKKLPAEALPDVSVTATHNFARGIQAASGSGTWIQRHDGNWTQKQ